jgi:hypothetical protein
LAHGEVIRIFGRTFSWGCQLPPARVYLRRQGGGPLVALRRADGHREDGHTERWCLAAWLPNDLPPGRYEVLVHGGTGMHQSVIANLEAAGFRPGERTDSLRRGFRPALLQGMGHFVIQDLTLRFMPATAPALEIGRDEVYVEDIGLYRVRFESRQDYGLSEQHDYTTPPVSIFNARRLRMVRCETYGSGGVSCQRKLEDCQFSQNTFAADRR